MNAVGKIKTFLRDQLGLPPFVLLAAAGCLAYLSLNALLRKPLTSAWGLLAPLVLGLLLESYEIWVEYRDVGLFAPGNDPLAVILARHALDVAIVLVLPLLLTLVGVLGSHAWNA